MFVCVVDKWQAYARIGMGKEAADAASQSKDGELLGRLRNTLQDSTASSFFDTLRDRLSFPSKSLVVIIMQCVCVFHELLVIFISIKGNLDVKICCINILFIVSWDFGLECDLQNFCLFSWFVSYLYFGLKFNSFNRRRNWFWILDYLLVYRFTLN